MNGKQEDQIFRRALGGSEKNIVEEWENIVSSLDFCEMPEDSGHIRLFLASSLIVVFPGRSTGFSCETTQQIFSFNTFD